MADNSQKIIVALKFLNKILANIGRSEIQDLEEFAGIDREDIIKEENKALVAQMEEEIYEVFDKAKVGYYSRNKVKCYIMTLIRGMMNDIGFQFYYKRKEMRENNVIINKNFYSIKPLEK